MEDAVVAEQALAAPTAKVSRPAAASVLERRASLLVATLVLAEAVWLSAIGLVLHWLLT